MSGATFCQCYNFLLNKKNYVLDIQFLSNGKQPQKSTQTEVEAATSSISSGGSCNCDAKYNKIFNDFKSRLEADHRSDKERALKDQEHRVSFQSHL